MSIREKLLDLKRRLSDRKMYSIVIVIIAAVSIFGIYQYRQAIGLRQELDNRSNRAFYDMAGHVRNVEVLLTKSLVTSTPTSTAVTLQEAWRQANMAQANLGLLPISQPVLANTSKFLVQVGDFAYSLNNENMTGNSISQEQYETLQNLHGYAVSLGESLNELEGQILTGRIKWGELVQRGTSVFRRTSENLPMQQIENIDKTFQEYPELIYDGPFSDHLTTEEPKGISGDQINVEEGKQKVMEFFGQEKVQVVENVNENNNGTMKTYGYEITFNNVPEDQKASMGITQIGGLPVWMIYNRPVQEKKIDVDSAKRFGKEFLESRGFNNMEDTYYTMEDNTATINYAYTQENVTIYTDLIKVKIALDNGEILGFEAEGYLFANTQRDIPTPKITEEEARALINPNMEILSSGLAIIPTNFKTELFTYEFKGKQNGQDFLIYINAENGKEEQILIIIDSERGILTM